VPRDLFAHAVIHEYVHARLLRKATGNYFGATTAHPIDLAASSIRGS
jgi:hypothetical protein